MKTLFKFFMVTVGGALALVATGCASMAGAGGSQVDLGGSGAGSSHVASNVSGQPDYRDVISDPGRF